MPLGKLYCVTLVTLALVFGLINGQEGVEPSVVDENGEGQLDPQTLLAKGRAGLSSDVTEVIMNWERVNVAIGRCYNVDPPSVFNGLSWKLVKEEDVFWTRFRGFGLHELSGDERKSGCDNDINAREQVLRGLEGLVLGQGARAGSEREEAILAEIQWAAQVMIGHVYMTLEPALFGLNVPESHVKAGEAYRKAMKLNGDRWEGIAGLAEVFLAEKGNIDDGWTAAFEATHKPPSPPYGLLSSRVETDCYRWRALGQATRRATVSLKVEQERQVLRDVREAIMNCGPASRDTEWSLELPHDLHTAAMSLETHIFRDHAPKAEDQGNFCVPVRDLEACIRPAVARARTMLGDDLADASEAAIAPLLEFCDKNGDGMAQCEAFHATKMKYFEWFSKNYATLNQEMKRFDPYAWDHWKLHNTVLKGMCGAEEVRNFRASGKRRGRGGMHASG